MFHKMTTTTTPLLILLSVLSVSKVEGTSPEERLNENEKNQMYGGVEPTYETINPDSSSSSSNNNNNNIQQSGYPQTHSGYSNPSWRYPSYTRPMYNWAQGMNNYPVYSQQQTPYNLPAWQTIGNSWQIPSGNSWQSPRGSWQSYPSTVENNVPTQYGLDSPTAMTYTDNENGFYPGSPNWRKSYTPSSNGCFNRCRPTCGYNNYMYGCRPSCRPSCNIRPNCGSSLPSYYGNTMVCSRNNGYYTQGGYGGYRGGAVPMNREMTNDNFPTSASAQNSGSD